MKNEYYKVKLRMGPVYGIDIEGNTVAVPLYYSEGYCMCSDNLLEGFLNRDYICGTYDSKQKKFFLEMLYEDIIIKRERYLDTIQYDYDKSYKAFSFCNKLEESEELLNEWFDMFDKKNELYCSLYLQNLNNDPNLENYIAHELVKLKTEYFI